MKLSTFLLIKAVIAAAFGVVILLAPVATGLWYGVPFDPIGALMGRYFGAMMIGTALVCWFLRGEPDTSLRRGLLLALFVQDTIALVVALSGQVAGEVGALGWVNVVIWLLLAAGLGYFRFVARD